LRTIGEVASGRGGSTLPRQFGSYRSVLGGSVTDVFAVLEPGNDSQLPDWRVVNEAATAGLKLAPLIPACFSPTSNTHNIAACSLGCGTSLVEATAREPADAEWLSAGRLGAVGAETPCPRPAWGMG
jgi:hypothetical protein